MQFLKILFWCLLAFVAALFTYGNWTSVPIQLWSGTEALVKLPFLLLVAFLIGFLPTYLYYHAVRWRLRARLGSSERALSEARALPLAPPPSPPPNPSLSSPASPPAPIDDAAVAEGRLV